MMTMTTSAKNDSRRLLPKNGFLGFESAKATDEPSYGVTAVVDRLWSWFLLSQTDEILFSLPQCANATLHFAVYQVEIDICMFILQHKGKDL